MVARASVQWIVPPTAIAAAIELFKERLDAAVLDGMGVIALEAEAYAKANHPWNNQTGRAEAGLNAYAELTGAHEVSMYLSHGVPYGIFLELKFAGRDAIILPTITEMMPRVWGAILGALN